MNGYELPNNIYGADQNFIGSDKDYIQFRTHPTKHFEIKDLTVTNLTILGQFPEIPTQKQIRSLADFPTPIGGVIQLEANTNYYIQGDVDIGSNKLDFFGDNVSIRGVEKRITFLRCNNTDEMFQTTSDSSITVIDITLIQEGTGDIGTLVSNPVISRCTFQNVNMRSLSPTGAFLRGSAGGVLELQECALSDVGYVHTGVGINVLRFRDTSFADSNSGITNIDFESGTQTSIITIQECFLLTFGGGISLRAVTPDLLLNATVTQTTFTGFGTLFDGMSEASNTWNFSSNFSIPNSHSGGAIQVSATALPVTINTLAVWEDVSGTGINWVVIEPFQKYNLDDPTNGEIIYTGGETKDYTFSGYLTFSRSSPSNILIQIGVDINGTIVPSSIVTVGLETNRLFTLTMPVSSKVLETGDLLKLMVRNLTDTTNIDLTYGGLSIH